MEIQKSPEENVRLRWLEGEACLTARPLWEEVFSEDSAAFTEYYFTQKAVRNRGVVLEGEDGLRAMLYLTPEKLRVKGSTVDSAYIVGVATREQYRHRGYMSRLLRESMTALAREGMPFAFLMPASPDIYTPFGFVWIYDRPVWDAGTLRRDRLRALGADEADRTARFASDLLEKEKAVYVLRDAAYYRLQARELAAQNGCVLGYEEAGRGSFAWRRCCRWCGAGNGWVSHCACRIRWSKRIMPFLSVGQTARAAGSDAAGRRIRKERPR